MLKGINQAMVNRSIAGGGGNCKCIGGNAMSEGGSNGSGVNGGKITVEFTVYSEYVSLPGEYKLYIKKEDAEKILNEILSMNLEKYMFYLSDIWSGAIVNGNITYTYKDSEFCKQTYTAQYLEDDGFVGGSYLIYVYVVSKDSPLFVMQKCVSTSNTISYYSINYEGTDVDITNDSIPDTADATTYKLTLYYREH